MWADYVLAAATGGILLATVGLLIVAIGQAEGQRMMNALQERLATVAEYQAVLGDIQSKRMELAENERVIAGFPDDPDKMPKQYQPRILHLEGVNAELRSDISHGRVHAEQLRMRILDGSGAATAKPSS